MLIVHNDSIGWYNVRLNREDLNSPSIMFDAFISMYVEFWDFAPPRPRSGWMPKDYFVMRIAEHLDCSYSMKARYILINKCIMYLLESGKVRECPTTGNLILID